MPTVSILPKAILSAVRKAFTDVFPPTVRWPFWREGWSDSRLTFSRAGSRNVFNARGQLVSLGNDVLPRECNPVGVCQCTTSATINAAGDVLALPLASGSGFAVGTYVVLLDGTDDAKRAYGRVHRQVGTKLYVKIEWANSYPTTSSDWRIAESWGLWLEPASTNQCKDSTFSTVAAGVPGTISSVYFSCVSSGNGLTREIVGKGYEDGIPYFDLRYYGTPTVTSQPGLYFYGSTKIPASQGQTWTTSAFVRLVAGSLANVPTIYISTADMNESVGTAYTSKSIVPTSAPLREQRKVATRTMSRADTAYVFGGLLLQPTTGQPIDITLRIGCPQMELGPVPTSPIFTAAAAASRAADSLTVTGSNFDFWGTANSMLVDYSIQSNLGTTPTKTQLVRYTVSGSVANSVLFVATDSAYSGYWANYEASTVTVALATGTTPAGSRQRSAVALAASNDAYSVTSYNLASGTDGLYNLVAPNQLEFYTTQPGPLYEFMHWNTRVPNYVLKELTRR